jgi:hypothetical protein
LDTKLARSAASLRSAFIIFNLYLAEIKVDGNIVDWSKLDRKTVPKISFKS